MVLKPQQSSTNPQDILKDLGEEKVREILKMSNIEILKRWINVEEAEKYLKQQSAKNAIWLPTTSKRIAASDLVFVWIDDNGAVQRSTRPATEVSSTPPTAITLPKKTPPKTPPVTQDPPKESPPPSPVLSDTPVVTPADVTASQLLQSLKEHGERVVGHLNSEEETPKEVSSHRLGSLLVSIKLRVNTALQTTKGKIYAATAGVAFAWVVGATSYGVYSLMLAPSNEKLWEDVAEIEPESQISRYEQRRLDRLKKHPNSDSTQTTQGAEDADVPSTEASGIELPKLTWKTTEILGAQVPAEERRPSIESDGNWGLLLRANDLVSKDEEVRTWAANELIRAINAMNSPQDSKNEDSSSLTTHEKRTKALKGINKLNQSHWEMRFQVQQANK